MGRARRDLRPRPRRQDHRASRSFRATAQLLGRLRVRQLPPGKFEPVGLSFVGASLSSAGAMEAHEHAPEGLSIPAAVPRRPAGRGEARLDLQYAPEARRPLVPRICQELRPRARRGRCPTRILRRTSSSSIWAAMATRRFGLRAMRCGPSSSASRGRSRAATRPDGGPIRYRIVHTCEIVGALASARSSVQQVLEGDPGLSV